MIKINSLFDNNLYSQSNSLKDLCPKEFCDNDYEIFRNNLKPYSQKKLLELQEKYPGLIIFPQDIRNSKDKIQKSILFSLDNEYLDDPKKTKIITSNLMGFFGIKNAEIHIHSRFDEKYKNDNFLHYMLARVFYPNVVDLPHSTTDNGNLNLLIFAFPIFLYKAIQQGVYKEYKTEKYNNPNVHGIVDIKRQLRLNIPFNGNIAYKTREYSTDNYTTQLIRHTIEYIKTTEFGAALLEQIEEMKNAINIINQITSTYNRNNRLFILSKNLNSKINSFYSEYLPLQKLCIQILRYECIDFVGKNDGLYGILFDGAWLWEEYLNTLLNELELVHAENNNQINGIKLFADRNYFNYPDFYKTGKYIFDAKYKKITKDENLKISIDSADYHQMITYMRVQDAPIGGFVYPLATDNIEVDTSDLLIGTIKGEQSLESKIYHFPMLIPQDNISFEEFSKKISQNEKLLIKEMNDIISQSYYRK